MDDVTPDELEAVSVLLRLPNPVFFDQEEEEEDEEEEYDEESVCEDDLEVKSCMQTNENKGKKRKVAEVDNSEETLECMRGWETLGRKLMDSDVKDNQYRLMLRKEPVKKMMDALGKTEKLGTKGLNVSVYGPNGENHKMVLKIWIKGTPVLTSGWKNFVKSYKLEKHVDFLTIWMFRHKKTREICFAIDSTRFPVKGTLSKRILQEVFKNP
ncbi:DNA-binding pseudobarrel domain superfamily [Arabidopsis suecica]|uniref:DNA-binding pseudobarrel domain superfamily n=1 Tax=Arabidopsis suecica TaxID=45249 RepID=A0A8T2E5I5_ARASU|nr:DNA-binding pseudobarrel domain superfamily [Arabidopsis suecica]